MGKEIAYIGAGSASLFAAIESGRAGKDVTIFEKEDRIGAGTSDASACRINLGPHYNNEGTIAKVQEESIHFVRTLMRYYQEVSGIKNPDELHKAFQQFYLPQGCDYLLHKDSPTTPERLRELVEFTQKNYADLCKKDPENQVFGDPEDLVKKLDPAYYEKMAQTPDGKPLYTAGWQVEERFIDWPLVLQEIITPLLKKYKIQVRCNTPVLAITRPTDEKGYTLRIKQIAPLQAIDTEQKHVTTHLQTELQYPAVVNATCESAAWLNETAGHVFVEGERSLRPKLMVGIDIQNISEKIERSRVVVHGSFSALTKGKAGAAFVTAEVKTTGPTVTGKKLEYTKPEDQNLWVKKDNIAIQTRSQETLTAARGFFNELKDEKVTITRGRIGVVVTHEDIQTRTHSAKVSIFRNLFQSIANKLTSGASLGRTINDAATVDEAYTARVKEKLDAAAIPEGFKKATVRGFLWTTLMSGQPSSDDRKAEPKTEMKTANSESLNPKKTEDAASIQQILAHMQAKVPLHKELLQQVEKMQEHQKKQSQTKVFSSPLKTHPIAPVGFTSSSKSLEESVKSLRSMPT